MITLIGQGIELYQIFDDKPKIIVMGNGYGVLGLGILGASL
jgi:hypothetical protein